MNALNDLADLKERDHDDKRTRVRVTLRVRLDPDWRDRLEGGWSDEEPASVIAHYIAERLADMPWSLHGIHVGRDL